MADNEQGRRPEGQRISSDRSSHPPLSQLEAFAAEVARLEDRQVLDLLQVCADQESERC